IQYYITFQRKSKDDRKIISTRRLSDYRPTPNYPPVADQDRAPFAKAGYSISAFVRKICQTLRQTVTPGRFV
ncbi:MAG: hypothetical protein Q3X37_04510, partial [Clostridia bacterium]|nr:hypothetical protein [Clostridia bacterium]